MSQIARNMMWGLLAATTTRAVRKATRSAMHNEYGERRLPRAAQQRSGLGMALAWAAGTGAVLALADIMREQRAELARRPRPSGPEERAYRPAVGYGREEPTYRREPFHGPTAELSPRTFHAPEPAAYGA